MSQACRTQQLSDQGRIKPRGSHAGLLLDRYLTVAYQKSNEVSREARATLREQAGAATGFSTDLYQHAFNRWQDSLVPPAISGRFQVQGRLIVGLGNENVLETGVTLHQTYGVPLIPGSALKGLAAHYAHEVWGAARGEFHRNGVSHRVLFGTSDESGLIHFHDAWWVPTQGGGLAEDVLTPHHAHDDDQPPTDFDDPNPVSFFSITGTFLVAVTSVVPTNTNDWGELAFQNLTRAIGEWGVGGKTRAGYGRLIMEGVAAHPPENVAR